MHAGLTKFSIQPHSVGAVVVVCHGGLSWEDRDVLAAGIEQHLPASHCTGVVMDLAEVEYVNSAGIGALFQLVQSLKRRGGKVVFANTAPRLLALFRMVGLDRAADSAATVEDAVALLSSNSIRATDA